MPELLFRAVTTRRFSKPEENVAGEFEKMSVGRCGLGKLPFEREELVFECIERGSPQGKRDQCFQQLVFAVL